MRTDTDVDVNADWALNQIVKPAHMNALTRSIKYDYVVTAQMLENKTGEVDVDDLLGGSKIHGVNGTYHLFLNCIVPDTITLKFKTDSIGDPSGELHVHVHGISTFNAKITGSHPKVYYYFHTQGSIEAVTFTGLGAHTKVGTFNMASAIALPTAVSTFMYENALGAIPTLSGHPDAVVREAWMSNGMEPPPEVFIGKYTGSSVSSTPYSDYYDAWQAGKAVFVTYTILGGDVLIPMDQIDSSCVIFSRTVGTVTSGTYGNVVNTIIRVAASDNSYTFYNASVNTDAQVQSDWNEADNTKPDFIKNKPTIPTVPVQDVTVDGVSVLNPNTHSADITTPTVDQSYDETSANAQSGVAVAEALQTIPVGLFEAVYGTTTYADIAAAVAANRIVYCRVPQQNNQSRYAFLAYVGANNFEFQYYRSVRAKTATAQGDEVYVYTVFIGNTWSTATRNNFLFGQAGNGLSRTVSGDNITWAVTNPVPAASSFQDGYVLTANASLGGMVWQGRGNVLAANSTGNINITLTADDIANGYADFVVDQVIDRQNWILFASIDQVRPTSSSTGISKIEFGFKNAGGSFSDIIRFDSSAVADAVNNKLVKDWAPGHVNPWTYLVCRWTFASGHSFVAGDELYSHYNCIACNGWPAV